jgi:hypothetical protein
MRDKDSDGVGFVTAFEIPEQYFGQFQVQTVGLVHHQELWVPATQLDEFNDAIVNSIRIEKAFIGKKFIISDKIKSILP